MRAVAFLGTMSLIVGLIHWYLWRRLVRDTLRPGRARRIATGGLVALGLMIPEVMASTRAAPLSVQRWVAWPGYLWLAVMFYLLVLLVPLELPRLALRGWVRGGRRRAPVVAEPVPVAVAVGAPAALATGPAGPAGSARVSAGGSADPAGGPLADPPAEPGGPDESRRLFLARSMAIVAGLAAVGITGSGVSTAMGRPQLLRVPVTIGRLPRRLDGLRIAVIGDQHLGPFLGRPHTERVVSMVNDLNADLIAIVGDLVDGTVAELAPAVEPMRRLRSRKGAFFVTGNHEYYSGFEPWIDEVRSLGITVLRNERVEVDGLDVAGVNDATADPYGDAPDYEQALGDRDRAKPVVLLAHQPVQAHEAARYGVDLQLSGHTHGGQFVPFDRIVALQQPVLSGLGRVGDTQVYVTNGAGFWGPPVRIGAPPDVTLVELRSK